MSVNCIKLATALVMYMYFSSVKNHGFDHRLGKTNDCTIDFYCFYAKHTSLIFKSRHWLFHSQDVIFKCRNCCFIELVCQCVGLMQSWHHQLAKKNHICSCKLHYVSNWCISKNLVVEFERPTFKFSST
jgi:hypothetical protein